MAVSWDLSLHSFFQSLSGERSQWYVFYFMTYLLLSASDITQYIGVGIQIVGTILQVTAKTIAHLIIGRIITGIGVGIMTAVVPTV